ncbi:hypothetical protein MKW98_000245 [Papaver atlanticum]|uniref:CCHC-type domain-containing protein n=1 Tax=Papaver atlanticum TaxID=357466 RepID=A0AAD4S642_9MAGN|nr:hypothetical protein MKW98_000245 [Papaver atlanticum]
MTKKEKMKAKVDDEEFEDDIKQKSVILLSSDDEEANGDLTLEIVEKARVRENKRKRNQDSVITLSSSSSDEVCNGGVGGGDEIVTDEVVPEVKKKKKKRGKKKRRDKEKELVLNFVAEEEVETVETAGTQTVAVSQTEEDVVVRAQPMEVEGNGTLEIEELAEKPKSEQGDGAEVVNNVVLRKLLRGPRYFDPPETNFNSTCYNCGEEGHMAVNCKMEKRKKPCFVCGSVEHGAKKCKQGQDCYICKKTGHRAKKCPEKDKVITQLSEMCLRCGDYGHNMFSCFNDYAPEDLKEIQCYICKMFGHLCCVDFMDTGTRVVSCYNCGQSGHTGLGCAKRRGDTSGGVATPTLCYKCGEEGHFARGCTTYAKPDWRRGEFSTPVQQFRREVNDSYGARSLPHDICKPRKKKNIMYDGRDTVAPVKSRHRGGWMADDPSDTMAPVKSRHRGGWIPDDSGDTMTPVNSRHRGGWITDDAGDFSNRNSNGWSSPSTPAQNFHRGSSSYKQNGHHPNTRSPKKPKHNPGTPTFYGQAKPYVLHEYTASRFGNSNSWGSRKNNNWY